jgi:hypothetical protein
MRSPAREREDCGPQVGDRRQQDDGVPLDAKDPECAEVLCGQSDPDAQLELGLGLIVSGLR